LIVRHYERCRLAKRNRGGSGLKLPGMASGWAERKARTSIYLPVTLRRNRIPQRFGSWCRRTASMEVQMAYRSGTYVAFHAGGTTDPFDSDMKYYRMLTAWHEHDGIDFRMVNSHEKAGAVRDGSSKARLKAVLSERLRNSKNMVLIVTP